jgi:energy-coupling factor transporter ATP-binding protein EcfA2
MIQRIYVDNYKCLINFDWAPGRLQLLLGRNGSGKTAVFEVLNSLREFALGRSSCAELFPERTRARWLTQSRQTFELELGGHGGVYRYRLQIEQSPGQKSAPRVFEETLSYNGEAQMHFREGVIHFREDEQSPFSTFRMDPTRSGVGTFAPLLENSHLVWFKERLARVHCIQLNPWRMSGQSETEDTEPSGDLSNFSSWYRQLAHENPVAAVTELFDSLREVLDAFDSLRFGKVSDSARVLEAWFQQGVAGEFGQARTGLRLDELSHGQRCLIALYTLLHCAVEPNTTLGLDEPDNFVALPEIEPWLELLRRRTEDNGAQVFLISHHPELINRLAGEEGQLFYRKDLGPTRVRSFPSDDGNTLSPAEIVARGWESDE